MHRLVIESSTTQASLALFCDAALLAEEVFPSGRGPVSRFFSTLERLVKSVERLDELIVGVGPGSYSGIRIGVSAAIGLQLARQLVGRGIYSALGYPGTDYQVILDARGSFIWSVIRANQIATPPLHCSSEELQEKIDPALPIYSPNLIRDLELAITFPLASVIGKRLLENPSLADLPLVPLYLKPPHITVAKPKP